MITTDTRCLDCESDLNFIESFAMTRTELIRWRCSNKDCLTLFSQIEGEFKETVE